MEQVTKIIKFEVLKYRDLTALNGINVLLDEVNFTQKEKRNIITYLYHQLNGEKI